MFYFLLNNIFSIIFFILIVLFAAYYMKICIDIFWYKDTTKIYQKYKLESSDLYNIKQTLKHINGREFEEFCAWLFKKTGKYINVELTPAIKDGGKDIILIDQENNKTYVECKRYTDNATVTEDFMIGREICQKLVGAMAASNIKNGLIVTTGNIHQNAWDYIVLLDKNSNFKLDIIGLDEIMQMCKSIDSTEIFNIVGLNYNDSNLLEED